MAEFEKKVRNLLKESGFAFERHGKGDHDIWYNPDKKLHITIGGKIKSRHSANELMKQCGIDFRFR